MENSEKVSKFEKELGFIKDDNIRAFATKAVEMLPDYFFVIPASSTGKYHPDYASGDGGLYRHTVAAVRIAVELFRTDLWKLTDEDKDLIIASLIVHDGFKSGIEKQQYTQVEHPSIMAFALQNEEQLSGILSEEQMNTITGNIASHMGKWNFDYKTKAEVLPKPKTITQRFVHLADYIASRKCLEFNFDVDIVREE